MSCQEDGFRASKQMKLSVIIPCLNAAAYLAGQLEALAGQEWSEPWEIIVSDNGSTDGSQAVAARYQERLPNLRLVDSADRRGAAHARNVGARAAAGELLAFCDADDEAGPGWVAAIGRALEHHEFVASRFDIEKLNTPWVRNSHRHPQEKGLNSYQYPPYLPHAGGGGLGIRGSIHEAVGGFDESMLILEDTDYCWRVQHTGVALHFVPDAVMYVRYRDTPGSMYRQARTYAEYNVLLYKKYRPLGMPPLPWQTGLLAWLRLLRRLPRLSYQAGRARWLWDLGWRVGRLQGCIKHRVWAL